MSKMDFRRVSAVSMLVVAASMVRASDQVACHINYAGEDQIITVKPTESPYTIAPTEFGSHFLFRVVFETTPRELAAIKLYTYVNRDDAVVPIHIANYAWPLVARGGQYGFTGLQTVYEPLRDGELKYWCELQHQGSKK